MSGFDIPYFRRSSSPLNVVGILVVTFALVFVLSVLGFLSWLIYLFVLVVVFILPRGLKLVRYTLDSGFEAREADALEYQPLEFEDLSQRIKRVIALAGEAWEPIGFERQAVLRVDRLTSKQSLIVTLWRNDECDAAACQHIWIYPDMRPYAGLYWKETIVSRLDSNQWLTVSNGESLTTDVHAYDFAYVMHPRELWRAFEALRDQHGERLQQIGVDWWADHHEGERALLEAAMAERRDSRHIGTTRYRLREWAIARMLLSHLTVVWPIIKYRRLRAKEAALLGSLGLPVAELTAKPAWVSQQGLNGTDPAE